jgi:hypothetical protein
VCVRVSHAGDHRVVVYLLPQFVVCPTLLHSGEMAAKVFGVCATAPTQQRQLVKFGFAPAIAADRAVREPESQRERRTMYL